MSGRTLLLTSAVALSLVAAPAAAQDPAGKAPASAPRADPATAASGPDFPAGAEVLSVDGEPLGVLAYVDALGGERLLHIRRPDGTVTTAPAVVASRGEVVSATSGAAVGRGVTALVSSNHTQASNCSGREQPE